MGSPGQPWSGLFLNVGAQGIQFDNPISASNSYYAYLTNADQDESTGLWSLVFEMAPAEWVQNVYFKDPIMRQSAPHAPATLYQLLQLTTTQVLQALGVKDEGHVAEGSWYYLVLSPGTGSISGDILNVNFDKLPFDIPPEWEK